MVDLNDVVTDGTESPDMGSYIHTRLLGVGEVSLELQRKEAGGRVRAESCSFDSKEQCAEAQRWHFLLGVCRKQPWWAHCHLRNVLSFWS